MAEQDSASEDKTADSSQYPEPTRTAYKSSGFVIANAPEDVVNKLEEPVQRWKQRDSFFDYTLFGSAHDAFQGFTDALYDKTSLQLGINSNNLYQRVSDVAPDTDDDGVSSVLDVIARWDLINTKVTAIVNTRFEKLFSVAM